MLTASIMKYGTSLSGALITEPLLQGLLLVRRPLQHGSVLTSPPDDRGTNRPPESSAGQSPKRWGQEWLGAHTLQQL